MTIVWKDPPPKRGSKYDWAAIAAQLRAQPRQWALVFEWDKVSIVNAIRQGKVAAIRPEEGFEVRTANNQKDPVRMCSLYLRWVGEGK